MTITCETMCRRTRALAGDRKVYSTKYALWVPGPIEDDDAHLIFGDDLDVAIDEGLLEPIP